jgi:iron complex transport system substrate-binding protein
MKLLKYSLFFGVALWVFSCKNTSEKSTIKPIKKSSIKYAKGFQIEEFETYKKLIIKAPYQNSNEIFEYFIYTKGAKKDLASTKKDLQVPITKMVVTSTTHIPMIELLGEENSLVGFPYAAYISSEKTSALVKEGVIKEIGKENSLNTEILLDLQPQLVVGYSVSVADKTYTTIEKAGIPVIYNGDWLEEDPLGRAEWIKFFGLLYNKEKEADSIFTRIEKNYLKAKEIALFSESKPTILSGAIMSKDIWNLPAGESFVAQFLNDANVQYLWKDSKGKGSLSLSFESVFDKGKEADFWISPGYFTSKEQMLQSSELYAEFKAFKTDQIYTPSTKKGSTGGVIYYELAPTRPDLVLKDLIKITHPNLLPNYELTFFEKMK